MTVSELIEELKKYPPDIYVGGTGHYGELLEINSIDKCESNYVSGKVEWVSINIEWAGDEPD